MKVLWFTNTPSLYKSGSNTHSYFGGGWIESLERLISSVDNVELAISFYHTSDSEKLLERNVLYYPILRPKANPLLRLINNWKCTIQKKDAVNDFLKVIDEFKPDVIQIFGTEEAFGQILDKTQIPVVLYLQGVLNAISTSYYPPSVSSENILTSSLFYKGNLFGNSPIFLKRRTNKMAERERHYFGKVKYIIGRTNWDKSIAKTLAPQSVYYHVDEVLREEFYTQENNHVSGKKLVIVSTLSNTFYKGIDVVLKVAKLLKETSNIDFEWKIIGLNRNETLVRFFEKKFDIDSDEVNVNYLGRKSPNELVHLLSSSYLFVHPSYIDNSPNSVCEAQMMGLPVIACNVGGLSSLIVHNKTGALVPSNGIFEIVYEIIRLTNNKNEYDLISKNAYKVASERHNKNKIQNELIKVYNEILKN